MTAVLCLYFGVSNNIDGLLLDKQVPSHVLKLSEKMHCYTRWFHAAKDGTHFTDITKVSAGTVAENTYILNIMIYP